MKLLILLFPSLCFASNFHLTYHFTQGRIDNQIKVVVNADSFAEAIGNGAPLCYEAFKDLAPITEDFKLAMTDACANPFWDKTKR